MVDFNKLLREMDNKKCKLHCELCQNNSHELCDNAQCECKIYQELN